jgi:hypothetical protein
MNYQKVCGVMDADNQIIKLDLTNIESFEKMDTVEIKEFLVHKTNTLFAFVSKNWLGSYYLYFATKTGLMYSMRTQKRADRADKMRTFKKMDTAINYAKKLGIKSVTVIFTPTEFRLLNDQLITIA